MARTDIEIQRDIVTELQWEPSLRHDDIAVGVRDGVVTLAGFVDSLWEKWVAERVASGVKGVRAVADEFTVKLPSSATQPDPAIARAALAALEWNSTVPKNRIKIQVENGWVTLDGEVDWHYQKEAAENSVRHLMGVAGIFNHITVTPRPIPSDIMERIKSALQRGAHLEADRITVELDRHKVILRGTVRSHAERRDAERAARKAPGITELENLLIVDQYAPVLV